MARFSVSAAFLAAMLFGLGACSTGGGVDSAVLQVGHDVEQLPFQQDGSFPSGLPADGVQPWETLDSNGHVVPVSRSTGSINGNTDFSAGVEAHLTKGDTTASGEALRLNGNTGDEIAYAMYRVSMADSQPAVVSIDANLLDATTRYYVGISNYAGNRWQWQGPYRDNHVRIPVVTDGNGDYTSELGNTFVSVLVESGSSLDIVGIGVNQFDPADSELPPTPLGLQVQPVSGGLELSWNEVAVNDLAGYIIHHSSSPFTDPGEPGVSRLGWLEGAPRSIISDLKAETWVSVSAVDFGGNESVPGEVLSAVPLAGDPAAIQLTADVASAGINDQVQLSASGMASYDWDLDGDGIYEVTGDATGVQQAYTGATGIIRPRVRGVDSEAVALGGVSLIIVANTRPVCTVSVDKLLDYERIFPPVEFTFTGESDDIEDSAEELIHAWDFNGDGIYEENTDTLSPDPVEYEEIGSYLVRLRVEDSDGAWNTDSIPISVIYNQAPIISNFEVPVELFMEPDSSSWRRNYSVNAVDPEGEEMFYSWDRDGDGIFEFTDDDASPDSIQYSWSTPGEHLLGVRVSDGSGNASYAYKPVRVQRLVPSSLEEASLPAEFFAVTEWQGSITVVYRNEALDRLEAIRSYDLTGSEWSSPRAISDDDVVEGQPSLLVDGVNMYCTYRDATTGNLRYCSNNSGNPNSWSGPWNVDNSANETGLYSSLIELEIGVGVAYYDATAGNLKYATGPSSAGSWNTITTVVNSGDDRGINCQMVMAGDFPAVAYYNATDGAIEFVRAENEDGTSWDSLQVLPFTGNITRNFSLLTGFNGRPAIAYALDQGATNDIWFCLAGNNQGSSWGTLREAVTNCDDNTPVAGIGFLGGVVLAFRDNDALELVADDSDIVSFLFTDFGEILDDSSNDMGHNPRFSIVNNRLCLGYWDAANFDLRLAVGSYE